MRVATFADQISIITPAKVNEPMSLHTTFRIGGPADFYAVANDLSQLKQLYCLAHEYEIPLFLLGAGSNILVSDLGIRGLVVENRARHFGIQENYTSGTNKLLKAESGCLLARLARETAKLGFEGLEWGAGIPGTFGGAIVYNAGAYSGCIGDALCSIRVLNSNGHIREVQITELGFGYRTSVFGQIATKTSSNPIILEADLSLQEIKKEELQKRMAEYTALRRHTQPRGPSAGSIFKNPPLHPAGRLIEQVGLKGHRIGDAQITPTHANFIVNLGQATSVEVEKLIALANDKVWEEFGIQLDLEIGLVGERTELRGTS